MSKVYDYLKSAGVFYVATVEANGQPRVRPFGALNEYNGKLYLITSNTKEVYKQLIANPKAELCAMHPDRTWIRVACELQETTDRDACVAMLEANPNLKARYAVGDGIMAVFCITSGTATYSSFTGAPVTEQL